jgi:multiple sugar transport system permease protein
VVERASSTQSGAVGSSRSRGLRLRRPELRFYLWVVPAVALTIAILVPFGMAIFYSLTNYRLAQPFYEFVGIDNYVDTIRSPEFWHSLRVTALYAVIVCAIELPLGVAVAYVLAFRFRRFASLGRVLLILPLMVPPAIGGLLWQLLLSPTTGLYSQLLHAIGIGFKGFAASSTALVSVVLVDVWLFTPFVALIVLAALSGLPPELLEAAAVDGASEWRTVWRIVLPLLTPVILLVLIFRLIDSLRVFDVIWVTTQGGPGDTLMVLSLQQYVQTFQFRLLGFSLPYAIFLWVIIFAVAQVLVPLWLRSIRRYSLA